MRKAAFTVALSLALLGLKAHAEDSPHHFAASVGVVSDYAFRGVSQNDENPAFQASVDYKHDSGFYAGAWGSAIDFGSDSDADAEIDTYIGYAWPLNDDWKADVQWVRYNYPDTNAGYEFDYNELIGKITWKEKLTGTIGYSNDVFNWGETGIYYNLSGTCDLPAEFKLNAGVGYYSLHDVPIADSFMDNDGVIHTVIWHEDHGYVDYNIGVTRPYKHFEFGLSYVGTGGDGEELFGDLADDRLVASVKFTF